MPSIVRMVLLFAVLGAILFYGSRFASGVAGKI
jgi:hypothetical protein